MKATKHYRKSTRADKFVPFDKLEISKIVQMIESGVPRRKILEQYGMHGSTLTNWMNRYGSANYKAELPRTYLPTEKRSILRAVASGMSVREACVVFGIKSPTVIYRWIQMEKKGNLESNGDIGLQKAVMPPKEKYTNEQQKALARQLTEANLKILALQTMIDIAEDQFK